MIVIDEFSMLDYYLFRTAEGLCRKFAKQCFQTVLGRNVMMLGDPAQFPAGGRSDLLGINLIRGGGLGALGGVIFTWARRMDQNSIFVVTVHGKTNHIALVLDLRYEPSKSPGVIIIDFDFLI